MEELLSRAGLSREVTPTCTYVGSRARNKSTVAVGRTVVCRGGRAAEAKCRARANASASLRRKRRSFHGTRAYSRGYPALAAAQRPLKRISRVGLATASTKELVRPKEDRCIMNHEERVEKTLVARPPQLLLRNRFGFGRCLDKAELSRTIRQAKDVFSAMRRDRRYVVYAAWSHAQKQI